ncbi:MAG TPA: rhomboid family intramembrane serine protease [Terriglobales bacterium]|nr:rhomboid family intramembrane serine protease [Terriglobales bacterium]
MNRRMFTGREMTLSLPPFTRAVVWLLGINTGIFLLLALLSRVIPDTVIEVIRWFGLSPASVVHGLVWQVVTYSFLHLAFMHWFGNMLGLWMFGSSFESSWGTRRFLELYFAGVLGGALFSIALAYTGVLGSPQSVTIGASGGVYAILMAFGIVFAENEIMLIPFPFRIKAKYFVAILIVITVFFSLDERGGTNYLAHLGGLLFGYLYVKFGRRGVTRGVGESYFNLRNSYYRWKRRRAARKFEVYMRKHDRTVSFDDQGHYLEPEDPKKKGNGESQPPWVN